MFGSLQTDLLADDVGVLSLHSGSCFRFRLHAQEFILVPQLHLVLYRRYKNTQQVHKSPLNKFKSLYKIPSLVKYVTFPHGLLFLYRLLLSAQVLLVQGLLLKTEEKLLVLCLISKYFILNMQLMNSPVA